MASLQFLQWERYLFKEHGLVALNFGASLQLFNILVKNNGGEGHPVLRKITTTLVNLQAREGSDWEEIKGQIKKFLKGSLKEKDEDGIVERRMDGVYNCMTEQQSSIMMKLLKLLNLDGRRWKGLSWKADNVQTECIDSELIETLFKSSPPLWVPNLQKIALENPVPSKNGMIEMWLVTEIKYCTKLVIETKVGSSQEVELVLPCELASIPVPVPVTIGCEIRVENTGSGKVVATGKKVLLGFKAIKLVYNNDGILQHMITGGEATRPVFRGHREDDPNEYSSYHMGGLFVNGNEELLECLTVCES